MKPAIYSLLDLVKKEIPNVSAKIDAPERAEGHWFLDFEHRGHNVVAEWRPEKGFGVSSSVEDGYGEGPEEVFPDARAAAHRVVELLRTRTRTRPPDTVLLRELRALSRLTQEELAKRLGIAQGAVSRMERRRDMSISTLRRLVGAMGGELELVARFQDKTVHIGQFDEDAEDVHEEAACSHVSAALGRLEEPSATAVRSTAELESRLTSWLETLSTLLDTTLPHKVSVRGPGDSSDVICRSEGSNIVVDCKLAGSLSVRSASSLPQTCARLISHEVAHYLLWRHGHSLSSVDAELCADHLAGWIDGRDKQEPSIGASVFYELGCHASQCAYPPPRLRLEAYLKGHQEGAAGRPHELAGGKQRGPTEQSATLGASEVGLRYFVLRASSLEQTQRFYSALGVKLEEERHGTGPRHYAAMLGTSVLEFYPSAKGKPSARIGLGVKSISDTIWRIRSNGFSSALVHCDAERAMLRDPDGNDIELVAKGSPFMPDSLSMQDDARAAPGLCCAWKTGE